jgi:SHS2 domain-containing protein
LLTLSHTEQAIFCHLEFEVLSNTQIRAEVMGTGVEYFDEDIKAVTYHEAEVIINKMGHWETLVVIDI